MAIEKQDCMILLTELSEQGIDCSEQFRTLLKNGAPTIEVLKFINENRALEVTEFYEKLRKSYNHTRSKLYINIMKEEFSNTSNVLTTLASLNLQILLFNNNTENSLVFLKHSRFEEINKCLCNYGKTFDLIPCCKLLQLIKSDIKVLEMVNEK